MSTDRPNRPHREALTSGNAAEGVVVPITTDGSGRVTDRQIPADVARWLRGYKPQDVSWFAWNASPVKDFVLPAVEAAAPVGIPLGRTYARVLSLIAEWCVAKHIPLEIERVLDPDTVDRFIAEGLPDLPSRGTYRTVLRRLGRMLTVTAPWTPRPEAISRRKAADPYSAPELEALWCDAQDQSTAKRRQAATALIVLGAGAGLGGRSARTVLGTDVEATDHGVIVHVREPKPRDVVVLHEYEQVLLDLAAQAGDSPLIGVASKHRNTMNKLVASLRVGHGHPRLSMPRLRSTWIVTHLSRGTRLPELMRAAGTTRIEHFDELLSYVEPMDPSDAHRMLRGT